MVSEFLAQLYRDHHLAANSEAALSLAGACEYAGVQMLKTAGALRERAMAGNAVSTLHTAAAKSALDTLRTALDAFLKEDSNPQ